MRDWRYGAPWMPGLPFSGQLCRLLQNCHHIFDVPFTPFTSTTTTRKDAKTFRTVLPPTFPMVVFPRDFPPALRRLLSLLSSKKGIKEKCEFGSFALLLFFRGVWR